MDTEGLLAPATADAAEERYASLAPTAETLVNEVARAMGLSPAEFDEYVTDEVIATAHEALFASLLEVTVGSREEFDERVAETDLEVVELGSEHVERVVWHEAPVAGTLVAATFQNERAAAVETLRRQAFGRCYRELIAGA